MWSQSITICTQEANRLKQGHQADQSRLLPLTTSETIHVVRWAICCVHPRSGWTLKDLGFIQGPEVSLVQGRRHPAKKSRNESWLFGSDFFSPFLPHIHIPQSHAGQRRPKAQRRWWNPAPGATLPRSRGKLQAAGWLWIALDSSSAKQNKFKVCQGSSSVKDVL